MFREFGNCESVTIVTDRDSGRSRGFGFVEMSSASEADAAINALNGKDVGGRTINVSEARARSEGGGGRRRRRGGGRGRGGPSRRY